MALPAAILPVARVAGSALLKARPAVQAQLVSFMKKATNGRVQNVAQAVDYATTSKNNLAVVSINAAKAGVNPDELMPANLIAEARDQELVNLRNRVQNAYVVAYKQIDDQSVIKDDGSDVQQTMTISVINDVSNIFGWRSEEVLTKAHVALRMFLATSEQELTQAMNTRRIARQ